MSPFKKVDQAAHLSRGPGGLAGVVGRLREDIYDALKILTTSVAQPQSRAEAGAFTFSADDIGGIVHTLGAGIQAADLPSFATEVETGRDIILTIQPESALNITTITPATGVQIDGAGSGVPFVPAAGRVRIQLVTRDGVNFFSGTVP